MLSQIMCNSTAIAHSREKIKKAEECSCNEEDIGLWIVVMGVFP